MEIWAKFLLAWVPLFVAIDPIGIVPIFLAMTEDAGAAYRRRIAQQVKGILRQVDRRFVKATCASHDQLSRKYSFIFVRSPAFRRS